ncbi:hypothetical protein EDB84DRAFT_1630369 [Lactarius hengduanensis]|nr:hypothetical protein EDB84DRAFT_1630369 [Lactarius hengduanensis]
MQQNSAHFEERFVRAVQSAWQTFDEWQSRMSASVQDTWRSLGAHMASKFHPADQEWISFSARSDHLLDPETPLRYLETIHYPSKENPSVIQRVARTARAGSLRIGRPGQHAGRFLHALTRVYDGMVDDVRMLCARYLVASDALERSGPVAVRAARYVSEEEEEGEEEGSSVEEGSTPRRRRKCSRLARTATMHDGPGDEDTEPPSYRRPPHGVSEPAQPGYLYCTRIMHHVAHSHPRLARTCRTDPWQPVPAGKSPESSAPHTGVDAVADAEDETDGAGEVAGVGAGGVLVVTT